MVRAARQRAAVAAALAGMDGFRSAQDVHTRMRAAGSGVSLSTVYRAVRALTEDGALDSLLTAGGETLYRRCSTRPHSHLVCSACGWTVELDGPDLDGWTAHVATEHGFGGVRRTVELVGVCDACPVGGGPGDGNGSHMALD